MEVTLSLTAGAAGCSHGQLTATRTSNGASRTLHLTRADLLGDPDIDSIERDLLVVARHMVKTAGATTGPQFMAALDGKVVQL